MWPNAIVMPKVIWTSPFCIWKLYARRTRMFLWVYLAFTLNNKTFVVCHYNREVCVRCVYAYGAPWINAKWFYRFRWMQNCINSGDSVSLCAQHSKHLFIACVNAKSTRTSNESLTVKITQWQTHHNTNAFYILHFHLAFLRILDVQNGSTWVFKYLLSQPRGKPRLCIDQWIKTLENETILF